MKMEFYWSFLFLAVAEGKITKLSESLNNSSKIFLVTRKKQYASNSNHHTKSKEKDPEAICRLRNPWLSK